MLIGQKIGLKFLTPIALDALELNPLSEGDFYRGDLLLNVLKIPDDFWKSNPDLCNRVAAIKTDVEFILKTITEELAPLLIKYEDM